MYDSSPQILVCQIKNLLINTHIYDRIAQSRWSVQDHQTSNVQWRTQGG